MRRRAGCRARQPTIRQVNSIMNINQAQFNYFYKEKSGITKQNFDCMTNAI